MDRYFIIVYPDGSTIVISSNDKSLYLIHHSETLLLDSITIHETQAVCCCTEANGALLSRGLQLKSRISDGLVDCLSVMLLSS
jgi:hypothetical protein